jgi:hypothetical protein
LGAARFRTPGDRKRVQRSLAPVDRHFAGLTARHRRMEGIAADSGPNLSGRAPLCSGALDRTWKRCKSRLVATHGFACSFLLGFAGVADFEVHSNPPQCLKTLPSRPNAFIRGRLVQHRLVAQPTKAYHTRLDMRRGLLVGFSCK